MRKMGKLFKLMPITASTFIVGWLAIAGVPPFAGFWSKDEILLFAAAESPFLYVIGIVTAILTAFYMTRQVVMTFFGEQKWGSLANEAEAAELEVVEDAEPIETHGAHGEFKPHESPPFMVIPLVVLAGLSILGGIIQLPSLGIIPKNAQHKLLDWLYPIVEFEGSPVAGIGEAHIDGTWAYDNKVLLIFVAIACSLIGIAAGIAIYQRKLAKPIEPALFERGWGYDAAISWFMGKPGRQGFQAVADGDGKIIDGAVNGVATAVRETGGQIRKGQTGYVRQYAGVIGIGVVLLLGWFVVIRGIL
jgi:NADH-quinone oxidoreductase subunit L